MQTTEIFAELLVIGIGVLMALCIPAYMLIGQPLPALSTEMLVLFTLPALSLTYVLGIVFDRIADFVFDFIALVVKKLPVRKPGDPCDDKHLLLLKGDRLAELYLYSRSRMRICRSWALLSLLSAVLMALAFVLSPAPVGKLMRYYPVLSFGLAVACFAAWYSIAIREKECVTKQAGLLKHEGDKGVAERAA